MVHLCNWTSVLLADCVLLNPLSPSLSGRQQVVELANDTFDMETDEVKLDKTSVSGAKKIHSYVSQSAIALRCRVMPPPCIKNPYLMGALEMDLDPFGNQRSKCAGTVLVLEAYSKMYLKAFPSISPFFGCGHRAGKRLAKIFYLEVLIA